MIDENKEGRLQKSTMFLGECVFSLKTLLLPTKPKYKHF